MSEAPEELRLVIAIDYGTTYTGVAYATPSGNRAFLNEIDIVSDWGHDMVNLDKVPSVYSYSPSSGAGEQQWGVSLSPDAVAMMHTKLELDVRSTAEELDLALEVLDGMRNLHFQNIKASGALPPYTWKRSEQIAQDYLTKVYGASAEELYKIYPEELKARMPVDIVVTIPAAWSYRAKNSIFRAITAAGFNQRNFPKLADTLLVSEPEAAAIYTARYLKEADEADFLKEGECFTLCDCGGGTIDVVSYKVKKLHPTLELEAATIATGCKSGSIFIDLAFKKWLKNLLGEKNYQILDPTELVHKITSHSTEGPRMRELMNHFNQWKRRFSNGHPDIKMDLPYPLDNLNLDAKVNGGEIRITNGVMRSFFQPCVQDIVELIEGQIGQVEELGRRVRSVFLVGGFAESEYLQQQIGFSLELRNIQLRRPDTSWTAVVRGAVIFGIEKLISRKTLSTMIACPRSYGIVVSKAFTEIENIDDDRVVDPLIGKPMAKEQLMWFFRKGDVILSNEPRVVTQSFHKFFSESDTRKGGISIYTYDDDDIPERFAHARNELNRIHTLEWDLTNVDPQEFTIQKHSKRSPLSYITSFELKMTLDPQRVKVELSWKDKTLQEADIDV